ncbi:hypothetical protein R6L23_15420 [Streptomyces sp. SR27]|uniref:hypothetical protein n=1 Tax=Streptomyces sp. SR27 TaxID=3076630 RepID=UPI00295A8F4B|nr:hypothetical protein [Streptomyces sp. SR27]MDV9189586.1 hypothetical protein [Streptomyces sp. SR27]
MDSLTKSTRRSALLTDAADVGAAAEVLAAGGVVAHGYACPSNAFLARALAVTNGDILYITSANRSRQATGARDEPAHWRADALKAAR